MRFRHFAQLSVTHEQAGGCNCFPNCLFEQWLTQLVLGLCLLQYHYVLQLISLNISNSHRQPVTSVFVTCRPEWLVNYVCALWKWHCQVSFGRFPVPHAILLSYIHAYTHTSPQYFNLEVKSIPKMKLYLYLNIWAVALSKMSTIHYRKICQNGKTNETEGRAYHKEMDAGGSWTVKQQKQFCLFRSMKKYVIGIYLIVRW